MKLKAPLLLFPLLGLTVQVEVRAQAPATQTAADSQSKLRAIRDAAQRGEEGIPTIAGYGNDSSPEVRLEVAKRLNEIGGPRTQATLLVLLQDHDPEVQIRATDGIVNVYLPGYLKTGISRTLSRVQNNLRATFDTNDQVIDEYVTVPPEVIAALETLLKQPTNAFESRANAARALGVLRAQTTVPDLLQALYSKNDQLMFESLVALQKIRDPAAGPKLAFLVRDIAEPVQIAALHTVGILRTREALSDTRYLLKNTKNKTVEREALTALSRIADPADHAEFLTYLTSRDATSRTLGAEGLARIHAPADLPALTKAFTDEKDTSARLAEAFAMIAMGRLETNQFAPLRYLIDMLNRTTFRTVAVSYLTEVTREAAVRQAVYGALPAAARYEKTGIAIALSRSGEQDSIIYLQAMQSDKDPEVAQQGTLSLRTLQARLQ